jgi:protein-S-isoprenylcysteine O-methyltransferase Ste14
MFFIYFLLFLLNDPFQMGVPTIDTSLAQPAGLCTVIDIRALFIDIALFTMVALQHSGIARPSFKRAIGLLHHPMDRPMFAILSIFTFVTLLYFWEPLSDCSRWSPLSTHPFIMFSSGTVSLFTLGTILVFFYLFPDHIFGVHKYKHKPGQKVKSNIIYRWPYNMVRHPTTSCFLYFFWLGIPSYTTNHVFFSAVMTSYIFFGTAMEERDLHREFGKEYALYCRQVGQYFPKLSWFKNLLPKTHAAPP